MSVNQEARSKALRERTEKTLSTVQPEFAARVRKWMAGCIGAGMTGIYCYEGIRDKARQDRLFGLGRTREQCKLFGVDPCNARPKEKKVTNCTSRQSMHCKGLAVDWNAWDFGEVDRQRAAKIAKDCGLESGVRWKMRDDCHLQKA